MYSAITVANAFLRLAAEEGKKLTNMKLQKLVYIAHGWTLAILGRPLVREAVYAWQWGPVIRPLYEELKRYGAGVVTEAVPHPFYQHEEEIDSESMRIIRAVWKNYGKYPALQLSAITHKADTPWSETWKQGQYDEIPTRLIRDHYIKIRDERSKSK